LGKRKRINLTGENSTRGIERGRKLLANSPPLYAEREAKKVLSKEKIEILFSTLPVRFSPRQLLISPLSIFLPSLSCFWIHFTLCLPTKALNFPFYNSRLLCTFTYPFSQSFRVL